MEQRVDAVTNALALELIAAGRHDTAAVILTSLLTHSPEAHRARYLLGVARLHGGDVDGAQTAIDAAYAPTVPMSDELPSLPQFAQLVGAAARNRPGWLWPRYYVARGVQALPVVTDEALCRVVDRRRPATVGIIAAAANAERMAAAHRAIDPRLRVLTFEPASDGVSEQVDLLRVDAGDRSAAIVSGVLADGMRPAIVTMTLRGAAVPARLDVLDALVADDYTYDVGRDQLVAVHATEVARRRIHAWSVEGHDFDPQLVDDLITPPPVEIAAGVRALLEAHQVRFLVTPTLATRRTRFSIRREDLPYVLSRLLEKHGIAVHVEHLRHAHRSGEPIRLYVVGDGRRYLGHIVELDPWRRSRRFIRSGNPNRFVNRVPASEIEKTMYAFNPPYLRRDREQPATLGERFGFTESVLDVGFPIDVVVPWAAHEDTELLRSALRSIESYAPTVRTLHLVVDGAPPSWLDVAHPRMRIVSRAEVGDLVDVPDLAEHWLFVAPGVFLLGPCADDQFFLPSGLGRAYLDPARVHLPAVWPALDPAGQSLADAIAAFQATTGTSFHQRHLPAPIAVRSSTYRAMLAVFSAAPDALWSQLYPWFAIAGGHGVPGELDLVLLDPAADDFDRRAGDVSTRPSVAAVLGVERPSGGTFDAATVARLTPLLRRLYPVPATWEHNT